MARWADISKLIVVKCRKVYCLVLNVCFVRINKSIWLTGEEQRWHRQFGWCVGSCSQWRCSVQERSI